MAAILVLCAWIFGWFRGDINVMDFSADEVDHVELSCTDVHVDLYRAVVTDKDDIQMLIDSVNRFQHTGNEIKDIFMYGIFTGGSVLYEIDIYLSDGELFPFPPCFKQKARTVGHRSMLLGPWCRGRKPVSQYLQRLAGAVL